MKKDFQAVGRRFKVMKMRVKLQFHVVRKLAPVLMEMFPAMQHIAKENLGGASSEEQLESIAKFLNPILMGMSALNDKESEWVLDALLSTVEMEQPGLNTWAPLVVETGDKGFLMMIQDLELPVLLYAAGHAFGVNITSFFGVLQQLFPGALESKPSAR